MATKTAKRPTNKAADKSGKGGVVLSDKEKIQLIKNGTLNTKKKK